MHTLAVLGATGHIGSALVHHLLTAGHRVVAIARPSAKLDKLAAAGATTRAVDITGDATATLTEALRGADAAFLMIPPNVTHPDFLTYADQVSATIEQAVRASGLRKAVMLSSLGADKAEGTGPIVALHRLENRLRGIDSLTDVLFLRPTYFMENLLSSVGMIKGMGINGGPQRPDAAVPMIATRDIAAYAAKRLSALDFSGEHVQPLLGPRDYSMQEATRAIGAAIGRPDLPYVAFPYADAEQGMIGAGLSPSMASMYVEMSRSVNETGLFQHERRDAETNTPTTLEQWAGEAFAPAFTR